MFWVVTEVCTTAQVSKRVLIIRKFIKLAAACKQRNNFNSMFAVLSGLSNIAVSRLYSTWEKVARRCCALARVRALALLTTPLSPHSRRCRTATWSSTRSCSSSWTPAGT